MVAAQRRAVGITFVVVLLGLVLLLGALHLPPTRAAISARIVRSLEARYPVAIRIGRLDYNLARLDARLVDVEIASRDALDDPFFRAAQIDVVVGARTLLGRPTLRSLTVRDPVIQVHGGPDGTSNLPAFAAPADAVQHGGAPASIPPIDALTMINMVIGWSDASGDASVDLLGLRLDLRLDEERLHGTLRQQGTSRIRRGSTEAALSVLETTIVYDATGLALEQLMLATPQATVRADVQIADPLGTALLDGRFTSTVVLDELAAWLPLAEPLGGTIEASGVLGGQASAPTISTTVEGRSLRWAEIERLDASAAGIWEGSTLRIDRLALGVDGATLEAQGRAAFDAETHVTAEATWRDVPSDLIERALPDQPALGVATRLSGTATLDWTMTRPDALRARVTVENAGTSRSGTALDGRVVADVAHGTWTLETDQRAAARHTLAAQLRGTVDDTAWLSSTVTGTVALGTDDVASLAAEPLLSRFVPDALRSIVGTARVDLDVSGTLAEPHAAGRVEADDVHFAESDLRLDRLEADFAIDASRVRVDSLDARRGENLVQGDGMLHWTDGAIEGRLRADLGDVGSLRRAPPSWWPDGGMTLDGGLTGSLARPTATLDVESDRLIVAGQALERLTGTLQLAGDELMLERMQMSFGGGAAQARGRYDLETGQLRFELQGDGLRLQPIALEDLTVPVAGQADLRLTVEGAMDAVRVDGMLALRDLSSDAIGLAGGSASATLALSGALDDLTHADIQLDLESFEANVADEPIRVERPVRFAYDGLGIAVDGLALVARETRLEIDGRLAPDSDDALRASLIGDLRDFAPWIRGAQGASAPAIGIDALSGGVDLRGSLAYEATGMVGSADLTIRDATVAVADLPAATGIEVRAAYRNGDLEVSQLRGTWQQAVVDARATIPAQVLASLWGAAAPGPLRDSATLSARIDSITEDLLTPLVDEVTRDRLELGVDAELEFTFDRFALDAARGQLALTRLAGTIAGMPFAQDRPTLVRLDAGRLTVGDWSWSGQATQMAVEGGLDLTRPDGLDLEVLGVIDLRLVGMVAPAVAASGLSHFALWVRGQPGDPLIDGSVLLEGADARIATPRLVFTDLTGQLVLTDARLELTELRGLVNGGALDVTGSLLHDDFAMSDGALTIDVRAAAMQFPEGLRSELDADLTLRSSSDGLALTGVATIVRGAYREPITVTSQLLTAIDRQNVSIRTSADRSMLDRLALNIAIVTDDDIVVDNNYGRFLLGSDLRLIGSLAQPSLTGRAAIREGGLLFLSGNVYQLEASALDFSNPTRIEPELSLTARTRISGYDITLRLTGTPDELETDLSSDPSLGQSDLVSLLLTGRTLDEAGGAGAEVARDQVLGYLSGELAGVAGRAVGLDVLRIERGTTANDVRFDPGLVATETNPAARLTFGKRVSRDFELIFSQSLAETGDFTWIVNYQPYRSTTLRFVSRDNEDRSYEFWHDLSFGGASLPTSRGGAESPETVEAIEFSGAPGFDEQVLLDVLRLSAGDRFDFYRWQDDRDRLVRFYRDRGYLEASVRTRQRFVTDGRVALEYEVVQGPSTSLIVEGSEMSGDTLRQMTERWSTAIFDRFLQEDLEQLARRDLAGQGYLRAEVETQILLDEQAETKTIVVRAAPGQRFVTLGLQFSGNAAIVTDRLQRAAREASSRARAFLDPSPVVDAIRALYLASGFLEAEIVAAPPALAGQTAVLTVAIREGPLFRVSEIDVEGVNALTDTDARGTLDVSVGDPFEPGRIEDARRRLDEAYRRDGFNDVGITIDAEPDSGTAEVRLTVRVTEGRQQRLSAVNVHGLHDTNPGIVARSLRFTVGDPVDLRAWYLARKRLYDTGAFRRVDLDVDPVDEVPDSPDAPQPVITTVTLEEWPRYRLRYGFQVNDEHEPERESARHLTPGLVVDLTRRNLFGRAIRTGLAGRVQRRQQAGRVFLSMPALFGLPVASNVFLSRSRTDFGDVANPFISTQTDVTAEQRFRLGGLAQVSYGYSYGRTHTFERDPIPNDPFPFDVTVNIARLTTTTTLDTRDDLLDATHGWFHSSSFEYASELLGSDLRFAKYLAQQVYFHTLPGNVVLGTAVRFGVADAFGQEVIPSERFYAGGGNTVRGYADDSLGARTFLGDAAGGEALFIVNQEVRVPLGRYLQGVGFLDAGRPFAAIGDFSLRDLSASVGLGVRIRTPVVMLRVDFGQPLDRVDGQRPSGRFFFSIGQMF